jgi:hypothetical protein
MKVKHIAIGNLLIVAVIGTGWVKNIIKLSDCDFQSPYKAEVIHVVGLIPPVGMVTGWLNIDDNPVDKDKE